MWMSLSFALLCFTLAVWDVSQHHYSLYTMALCLATIGWLDSAYAHYYKERWEQKR